MKGDLYILLAGSASPRVYHDSADALRAYDAAEVERLRRARQYGTVLSGMIHVLPRDRIEVALWLVSVGDTVAVLVKSYTVPFYLKE